MPDEVRIEFDAARTLASRVTSVGEETGAIRAAGPIGSFGDPAIQAACLAVAHAADRVGEHVEHETGELARAILDATEVMQAVDAGLGKAVSAVRKAVGR